MPNPLPTADCHPCLPLVEGGLLSLHSHFHRDSITLNSPKAVNSVGPFSGVLLRGSGDRAVSHPPWSPLQGRTESVSSILSTPEKPGRSSSRNKPSSAHGPLPQGGACDLEDPLHLLGPGRFSREPCPSGPW